jgi:hypothetical protein
MPIPQIHAGLEAILEEPVSRFSLKDCLSTQSMREGSRLRRIRRGWYELR